MEKYIKPREFQDFCSNQKQLIDILNHRMTKVEMHMASISVDVSWTKKILWAILGVAIASLTTNLILNILKIGGL
jgi:hypothetical protein